jgi:benzoyl-CoA-dihydrodiol lyase
VTPERIRYRHVEVALDAAARTATLTLRAPDGAALCSPEAMLSAGASFWPLRAFRELDDALLRLRFNHEEIGLLLLRSEGAPERVLEQDTALAEHRGHGFVREVLFKMARVLRRLDLTARSLFAVVEPGSCFVGSLLEVALAADRRYALDDEKRPVCMQASALNGGLLPTANGFSRLHMLGLVEELLGMMRPLDARAADEAGLITVLADEIDFDDTLRLAVEERVSLSPDALTGMEASFRFLGPETLETKIFGRLSAWQNWIFTRPNAVGERGALSLYGKPERPSFDFRRT